MYVVIMAGGKGTRLWPLSRNRSPKQFLRLTGERTLLQEAGDRAVRLAPWERILVVTGAEYAEEVRRQLPDLPSSHVLAEPMGRGTAPCIGLAALYIAHREPGAVMAVLPADHVVREVEVFARTVRAAAQAVGGTGRLATLGIVPRWANPEYGYIQVGEPIGEAEGQTVHRVARFVEKPRPERAAAFLVEGGYLWNSGMFVWQASMLLREIERHLPDLHRGLERIAGALDTPEEGARVREVYVALQPVTIDYGVMEKAEDVVVLQGDFPWSDVGSWAALGEVLPGDADANVVLGHHLGIDTQGCVVHAPGRLVATLGLKDLVIVETDDALLVCPRDRAQEVRRLVELLGEKGMGEYR